MIDLIYKTLLTIINKENNGYISPTEFNILANKVQQDIFRDYFDNENRDKNRENKGLTNKGYANLDFNERQKISQFSESKIIEKTDNVFNLPTDLYFTEDDGITKMVGNREDSVIEEVEKSTLGYLRKSISSSSSMFPIYVRYAKHIEVYPEDIEKINLRYIREPKAPKWTYIVIQGKELFDPSNSSYQDFELHPSEFTNIVTKLLSEFSINLREFEVTQIAEQLKNQITVKDNN